MYYIFKARNSEDIKQTVHIYENEEKEVKLREPYSGYIERTPTAIYVSESRCIEFSIKEAYIANAPRCVWMPVHPVLYRVAYRYAEQIGKLFPTVDISVMSAPYIFHREDGTAAVKDLWIRVYSRIPITKQKDFVMATAVVLARTMSVAFAYYVKEKEIPPSFWDYLGMIYTYVPRHDVLPGQLMFHPTAMIGNPDALSYMGHGFAWAYRKLYPLQTHYYTWRESRRIITRIPENKIYECAFKVYDGELEMMEDYIVTAE